MKATHGCSQVSNGEIDRTRQRCRACRTLRKKMGSSDFIPGWKISGEQNDVISSGCCEKGPEGSRGRSRKVSEEADVVVQVSGKWWRGPWWVEMERREWILRAPQKESPREFLVHWM